MRLFQRFPQLSIIDCSVVDLQMMHDGDRAGCALVRVLLRADNVQQGPLFAGSQNMEQSVPFPVLAEQFTQFFRHGEAILTFVLTQDDLNFLPKLYPECPAQFLVHRDKKEVLPPVQNGALEFFAAIQPADNPAGFTLTESFGNPDRHAKMGSPQSVIGPFEDGGEAGGSLCESLFHLAAIHSFILQEGRRRISRQPSPNLPGDHPLQVLLVPPESILS